MLITTSEAREVLRKGLNLNSIAQSTFSSWGKKKLILGKVDAKLGCREQALWNEREVMESVERVKTHKLEAIERQKAQAKAKTQRAKENMKCKEPKGYTQAFSLFNKSVA